MYHPINSTVSIHIGILTVPQKTEKITETKHIPISTTELNTVNIDTQLNKLLYEIDKLSTATTNDDVFAFYSASANAAPGYGSNEKHLSQDDYTSLKNITNWRQILSNFYECKLRFLNRTFISAEHLYHAIKYYMATGSTKAII